MNIFTFKSKTLELIKELLRFFNVSSSVNGQICNSEKIPWEGIHEKESVLNSTGSSSFMVPFTFTAAITKANLAVIIDVQETRV